MGDDAAGGGYATVLVTEMGTVGKTFVKSIFSGGGNLRSIIIAGDSSPMITSPKVKVYSVNTLTDLGSYQTHSTVPLQWNIFRMAFILRSIPGLKSVSISGDGKRGVRVE